MKTRNLCLSVIGVLSAFAAQSQAAITVMNPSFENPVLADGVQSTDDVIPNWTVYSTFSGDAVLNPSSKQFAGQALLDGSNVDSINQNSTFQLLGTMVTGETYTFTISYGSRSDVAVQNNFAFVLRQALTGTGSNVLFAEDYGIGHSPSNEGTFPAGSTTPIASGPAGSLTTATLAYTATAADNGNPLGIQLFSNGAQLLVDNVVLNTTTVPEPASFGLLGVAGLGILGRRRRV